MLQSFTNTIQKALEQKSGKPGFWHTFKDYFGYGSKHGEAAQPSASEESSEVPLYYFSDDYTSIDRCIQAVESYCRDETMKKVIADEALEHLSQSQIQTVNNLENDFQVRVTFQQHLGQLTIEGIQQDVYNAHEVAQKLLREVDRLELERDKAQILSNMVQWHFVEIDDQGQEQQTPYDKEINGIIEKAYCDKLSTVTLSAGRSKYIIDFNTMEEYPAGNKTDSVKVVRKDLLKESDSPFELPSNWTAMGQDEDLKVVTLQATDGDYQTVSQSFITAVHNPNINIIKIERIQNKTLYQQYVAKKKQISKQRSQPPERKLWHGTSADAIVSLNTHGFNRSYCGKNATAYGDGVYFAVDARYSLSNTYSRPDAQGHKHMYYASVLTGDFITGQHGMRVPPAKSITQLYDSVVDNANTPGMFIIFNDTQAYPDYLITFSV
ncbi:protein mono-ADP-ribosyltransferase PARP14-like [Gigantopelta aegis]|uniref:protein mono-ADP-ribosyltransferase PARP14-like n=1 Tax=Gigantopelta aegis TaxID=1735272 RepID=UPI001B88ADDD|nr:protein mono-ADP-ribosyltransferase PARP14-like [Gigantopelta aegis]